MTALSDETGQVVPSELVTVIVKGQSANLGDTIIFTVLRTDGKHEQIKVVLGGVEKRQLFKVVADTNRYYQILPAVSIWQADKQSIAIGVAYLEEQQKLLLLGPSSHNLYRSHGHAAERTVVDVVVSTGINSEPNVIV